MRTTFLNIAFFLFCSVLMAQEVPSSQENIPYLVTFGLNSEHSWGDDDFSQTIFFMIPKGQTAPIYIRVYDPDTGGELDETNAGWNTKMKYSIYGGKGAYTDKDAQNVNPVGNYKSGVLIDSRVFGSETSTDKKWVTFGPFNPVLGEYVKNMDSYLFKLVIDGLAGDDGNLYKVFLSINPNENVSVEGANAFAFEYSVRLQSVANSVAHVYPFADPDVASFHIKCFDFDNDGQIKLYSSVKNGHLVKTNNDNEWSESKHPIKPEEKNKCLDLQIVKKGDYKNDVVFYITNEYDMPVPFYAAPLGGVPRYKYKISISSSAKAQK
ncbi:MAG: hypothetical protein IT236_06570 [Bacteroidia bacterium]|nr:hypothetical protein [Bacteroidia bacterium]